MSAIENVLPAAVVERLGWALVHFTWQATGIALALAAVLALLRNAPAKARYAAGCLALGLMVLAPAATLLYTTPAVAEADEEVRPADFSPQGPRPAFVGARGAWVGVAADEPADEPAPAEENATARSPGWGKSMTGAIERAFPWIVLAWGIGVLVLSVRNLGGWIAIQRLARRKVRGVSAPWQRRFDALARRLALRRKVRFLESLVLEVPAVIGWLRPVVLIPASALTGIRPDLLEAVLLHELAHIRRHDYLVNLVQTVVETLGFFHPAVWWVSRRIRVERENCCDDVAVEALGDRPRFARALVRLEEIRHEAPPLAVAGTGGILMQRIGRLIGVPSSRGNGAVFGGALGVVFVALLLPLSSVLGAGPPTVDELLARYAQTQQRLKSYIAKTEVSLPGKTITLLSGQVIPNEGIPPAATEIRTDGSRFHICEENPTAFVVPKTVFLPNDAQGRSWVWDGQVYYFYGHKTRQYAEEFARQHMQDMQERDRQQFIHRAASGTGVIYADVQGPRTKKMIDDRRPGTLGYPDWASIVKDAETVKVREKNETVGGSPCHVLEARKGPLQWTLWIDPAHGHHIAKMDQTRQGKPALKMLNVWNVKFQLVSGVWVPMENDFQYSNLGGLGFEEQTHFKVVQLTVNPDHEALKSFVPTPVEGAGVWIRGATGIDGKQAFTWQRGKIVDDKGSVITIRN
jgi:beta-lactamase regulating signal transducer with metallopeptidase domain